jgi:hypothetical protein
LQHFACTTLIFAALCLHHSDIFVMLVSHAPHRLAEAMLMRCSAAMHSMAVFGHPPQALTPAFWLLLLLT